MGTQNFVLDNDALDYQIRTNSGGVLNLIDGSTPSVDRSMLIDINRNDWKNHLCPFNRVQRILLYWRSSR